MSMLVTIRRSVGAACVAAAAAWPIVGATGHLRIPDDKLAQGPTGARVVHLTRDAGPTDVAPILLLGLLLWLPDVGSISIPGLITVRARLDETDDRVSRVEQAVHAQQQMAVTMVLGDPDRLPAAMREKATLLQAPTPAPPVDSLLERWEQLRRRAASYEALSAKTAAAVTRWRTVFGEELSLVEAAVEAGPATGGTVASGALIALASLETYLDQTVTQASDDGAIRRLGLV